MKKAIFSKSYITLFANILVLFMFISHIEASTQTYYLTENGLGNRDGLSPGSAWSVSDFNKSANWDSSENIAKIDPGECGSSISERGGTDGLELGR